MTQVDFLKTLQAHYKSAGRDLPWRQPEADGSFDAYKILVSEIMLQQTQVPRVVPKYQAFLQAFPSVQQLAQADLAAVLAAWSGLGYNRRAKYLWQAAQILQDKPQPWDYETLVACPGIGPNTAAAVLAYSYDLQVVFLETNIKTVLIHHFFEDRQGVSDKELLQKLTEVLPWNNGSRPSPRAFYWAMMDYGTHLKATVGNLNKQSKSYAKQSKFQGSKRQIRGQVIRLLLAGPQPLAAVQTQITDPRLEDVLDGLLEEKLVMLQAGTLMLYNKSIKP